MEKQPKNQMARQQDRRLMKNRTLSESSAFDQTRQPPHGISKLNNKLSFV